MRSIKELNEIDFWRGFLWKCKIEQVSKINPQDIMQISKDVVGKYDAEFTIEEKVVDGKIVYVSKELKQGLLASIAGGLASALSFAQEGQDIMSTSIYVGGTLEGANYGFDKLSANHRKCTREVFNAYSQLLQEREEQTELNA